VDFMQKRSRRNRRRKSRLKIPEPKLSEVAEFRKKWLDKGIELVDITHLCEFKLGNSDWCNNFGEPTENIYHIQVYYRKDVIGVFNGISSYVIDEDLHIIFNSNSKDKRPDEHGFIIFRKVIL